MTPTRIVWPNGSQTWHDETGRIFDQMDPISEALFLSILYGEPPKINHAVLAQHLKETLMLKKNKTPKPTIKGLQAQIVVLQKETDQAKESRAANVGQYLTAQKALSKILGASASYRFGEERVEEFSWPEIYAKVGALKQQVDVETLMRDVTSLSQRLGNMESSTFLKPVCPCQAQPLGYSGNTCGS